MRALPAIGRIFFGTAIAAIGLMTVYYRDFPYFLIPPNHTWLNHHSVLIYACGILLILAGTGILMEKRRWTTARPLGTALLLIGIFYFIPYEFIRSPHYRELSDWENMAKTLSLAGGAWVLTVSPRLIRTGTIIFGLTILNFGIMHFVYAREASGYIPDWIPNHVFWMYPTGAVLIISSLGIIFRIWARPLAILLGTMIFVWVIILHIPKATSAPLAENAGEVSSAFLALGYCGIAFVISSLSGSRSSGSRSGSHPYRQNASLVQSTAT